VPIPNTASASPSRSRNLARIELAPDERREHSPRMNGEGARVVSSGDRCCKRFGENAPVRDPERQGPARGRSRAEPPQGAQ